MPKAPAAPATQIFISFLLSPRALSHRESCPRGRGNPQRRRSRRAKRARPPSVASRRRRATLRLRGRARSTVSATSRISAARRSAVRHHPLQHIGGAPLPIEAGKALVERGEHDFVDPGLFRPARTHSQTSASSPLIMIERIILIADDDPTGPSWIVAAMSSAASAAAAASRVRAADQKRRAVQARMDRRHHRDVDVAPARRLDRARRARLGLRRAGIAVEEEGAGGEARQRGERRGVGLIGGDDGEDQLARRRPLRARSPRPRRPPRRNRRVWPRARTARENRS